ncbi:uncharacterized protein [Nicotiana sylvestris]|uniref:uncharacterized protein n=1 Tax=Nicotiana sylvestris TaxID=4096 RepID=UPI00388C6EC5
MQGLGGQVSIAYKDLCLFSDVQLPVGFKMPKFDLYDGHVDPVGHLRRFCSKMRGASGKDELLMAYFSQSLSGLALEWYTHQDHGKWYTCDDLAQVFARHFQYNIEIVPDRLSLTKIEKKPSESFIEYGFRWREQAARVNPLMEESEMVEYFLQDLEPTYFGHLISAIGKSFNEVVKMGSMMEEGLKSSKIMSYSVIKRKKTFPPLRESYTSLFHRLRHLDMLRPIDSKLPNPLSKNLDYSVSCEYCSGTPGHDTEKCWHLKNAIQELIDTNRIEVQTREAPNINQSPLPIHQEKNMIEIVHKEGEPKKPSQTVMMIRSSEVKPVKKPTVEGLVNKLSMTNDEHSVVVKKGSPNDVAAKQEMSKVVVPRAENKPLVIVEGARMDLVIIKPVTQLPVIITKAIPWNYERVIMTYNGKEVKEEFNQAQGLTRLGRCFALEELRKTKTSRDNPVLVKKEVTEEEVEEFLRKMKVQEYSIVE